MRIHAQRHTYQLLFLIQGPAEWAPCQATHHCNQTVLRKSEVTNNKLDKIQFQLQLVFSGLDINRDMHYVTCVLSKKSKILYLIILH